MIKLKGYVILEQDAFDALNRSDLMLTALEEGGVDNWTWYSEAMSRYEELLEEEYGAEARN